MAVLKGYVAAQRHGLGDTKLAVEASSSSSSSSSSSQRASARSRAAIDSVRVHPQRTFQPGDTYTPSDLYYQWQTPEQRRVFRRRPLVVDSLREFHPHVRIPDDLTYDVRA